jgi:hypothetical protein
VKRRLLILGVAAFLVVSGGAAFAKSAAPMTSIPFTIYGYEEVGPHSLLADPSSGVVYKEGTCYPSDLNCSVYEFNDKWDLSQVSEADGAALSDVDGAVDVHGFDVFLGGQIAIIAPMTMTFDSTTRAWFGGFTKSLSASTGKFTLFGTDGSSIKGVVTFLDDGYMQLSGTMRGHNVVDPR